MTKLSNIGMTRTKMNVTPLIGVRSKKSHFITIFLTASINFLCSHSLTKAKKVLLAVVNLNNQAAVWS